MVCIGSLHIKRYKTKTYKQQMQELDDFIWLLYMVFTKFCVFPSSSKDLYKNMKRGTATPHLNLEVLGKPLAQIWI